jgi:cyanocobalamin reductase (cyanide-eliminating) / alkylcobalamin dealkylase
MSSSLPRALEADRPSVLAEIAAASDQSHWRGLQRFQETLRQGGLDLLRPFSLAALAAINALHPRFSSHRPTELGIVVGNTRALWGAFLRHLRGLGVRSPDELGPDPLDIYVEELVHSAISDLLDACNARGEAVFSHELLPAPIPIQRIAEMSGLGRVGPAHLSVHPTYGPWFALRAVIALDLPASAGAYFATEPGGADPCERCEAPCRRALSGALLGRDVSLSPAIPAPSGLSDRQARWLRVRDACPVGREHRYSDAQILYHYDGKKSALFGRAK